ncbi:Lecithin:cholesterol/phospholipid:diacylglycerol acyltransferase [Artemisia annua]|uniref:Lecithin:cholesterol/phospholipid:diacylglycerol acyltransferase n=1 Tax=Artemisia annua TaxID=35608 RepID=A0A2U1PA05_ARTAN|nr:Lecithin:cholesterol/phospholipid:diacylglycerol acyltransferase [Artemisia annua]
MDEQGWVIAGFKKQLEWNTSSAAISTLFGLPFVFCKDPNETAMSITYMPTLLLVWWTSFGSPLLGSVQTVEATLSGFTFGLPVHEVRCLSFLCYMFVTMCYKCFHEERCSLLTILMAFNGVAEVYPSFGDEMQANLSNTECGVPTQLSFLAQEIADGTFFKAIEDFNPDSKRLLYQLYKLYHGHPVLNPLTPWERPPLKNIFCIYGVDLRTEVGCYFAQSGKPYPHNWIMTDVVYEFEGSLYTRSDCSLKFQYIFVV